ncbi:MAG TPA: HIRAN domain-containing protein [bacterium]|nr:HIRAN domain-containing protein [bacterium]HQL61520.1 HIRAN domain-containing protein [bacterium]
MERRSFFTALLGSLAFLTGSAQSKKPGTRRIELLRTPLAGYPYYEADRALPALKTGSALVLRREPENPFDRDAVEVLTEDGIKLGYIPRTSVHSISRNLDCGIPVRCRVHEIRADAGTWQRIWLECYVNAG